MTENMLGRIVQKLVQVPAETLGPLYDLLEKLIGSKSKMWLRALNRFLRKENPWGVPKTFEVITKNQTGIAYLSGRKCRLRGDAMELLCSKEFVTTSGK